MQLERCPLSASAPASSADQALGVEQRWQLLDEYLLPCPCFNRSQYARLAGRTSKQAVVDLNRFLEDGDAHDAWDGAACGVCPKEVPFTMCIRFRIDLSRTYPVSSLWISGCYPAYG